MTFTEVTDRNRHWVDDIFAGDEAQYWVHYNWYWEQQARERQDIEFRLIEVAGIERPVGVVAYGQYFEDEELTRPLAGAGEVIHMVIDAQYQRRGYGRAATLLAIQCLRERFERILIAHNPVNEAANRLYTELGFKRVGANYDGDPLLELTPTSYLPAE